MVNRYCGTYYSALRFGGNAVDLILRIQAWADPTLDDFFMIVTQLGSEEFYTLLVLTVYWCVSRRAGLRLGMAFLLTMFVNFAIKDLFRVPRPAGEGLRVLLPESGTGYGFPSGHTQGNTTVWGYLYLTFRRRWVLTVAVTLVLLVALSRVYLGLHYISDVLGGIAVGLAFLALFRLIESNIEGLTISRRWLAVMAAVLPLFLLAFSRNADTYRIVGMVIGFSEGYLLQEGLLRFQERVALPGQALKVILGLFGFMAIRILTRPFFPEGPAQIARYALLGLWAAWLAPHLFVRLGLGTAGGKERISASLGVSG